MDITFKVMITGSATLAGHIEANARKLRRDEDKWGGLGSKYHVNGCTSCQRNIHLWQTWRRGSRTCLLIILIRTMQLTEFKNGNQFLNLCIIKTCKSGFWGALDEMPIWQGLALLFGSGSNFGIEAFKWPQPRPKYPVKQPLASPG